MNFSMRLPGRFSQQKISLIIATLLLLLCVFMQPITVSQAVYDIQITFDISQSMNVEDVHVDKQRVSRITLAKSAARQLLKELPCGSRVGWSVFSAQRATTLITPIDVCQHYAALVASLEKIDGQMRWANASSIGKGIHQAMRAAHTLGDDTVVAFISDGHEAPPLRQGQLGLPKTDKFTVNGLLIGVGGDTPSPIPKIDTEGRKLGYWSADEVVQKVDAPADQSAEHLSRLHGEHLIKLAQAARFSYLRLEAKAGLVRPLKQPQFSYQKSTALDVRWVPALIALTILCWRFVPRP